MAIIQEKEAINLKGSGERLGRGWKNGTWQGQERENMAEVRERKWKEKSNLIMFYLQFLNITMRTITIYSNLSSLSMIMCKDWVGRSQD